MIIKYFSTLILLLILSSSHYSQFKMNEFIIRKSGFQEDLKEIKATNPDLSIDETVKAANELIQNKGVNYVFGLDEATCQKISTARANQKDKTQPLNLRAKLVSIGGDGLPVSLVLPEANFEKSQCVPCYIQLPVFEITASDFVSSIMGTNIKFELPRNFGSHEIQLIDNEDVTKILRIWKIPFLAEPLSVSDDGNIVYLGFEQPDLKDLTLLVFGEGTFMISARKEMDPNQEIIAPDNFPKDPANPNSTYRIFKKNDNTKTIKFSKSCGN